MVTAAPPGFVRIEIAGGFAAEFGPIYVKRDGERVVFGFHVEERHLNPRAHAHGGALATFADMQLAALMRGGRLTPKQAPTISLSLDFLAPAKLGDWVEGDIALVKRTGRLAFSETVLTVAGEAIARSRGMYAYSDAAASLDLPPPPQAAVAREPPPGFAPIDPGPGFGAFFGPMHYHAERKRLGFRVSPRHINLFGVCHGGAMAMFADYQIRALRLAGAFQGPPTATLSLSVDFLQAARLGDWIEADATLVRGGRRYLFTQAMLINDAAPVARTTAIYATRPAEARDG